MIRGNIFIKLSRSISLGLVKLKWFSERKGLKKSRTDIQVDSMDEALRNRLWNIFEKYYITPMSYHSYCVDAMQDVIKKFYDSYLKEKTDIAPSELNFNAHTQTDDC